MEKHGAGAEVISLDEARTRLRPQRPLVAEAEFFKGMQMMFEALELIEDVPTKRARKAYDLLLGGLRIVYKRERKLSRG